MTDIQQIEYLLGRFNEVCGSGWQFQETTNKEGEKEFSVGPYKVAIVDDGDDLNHFRVKYYAFIVSVNLNPLIVFSSLVQHRYKILADSLIEKEETFLKQLNH